MNKIKDALDHRVSKVQWSETDTQSVLNRIREEDGRKRLPLARLAVLACMLLAAASVYAERQWGVLDWLLRDAALPETPIETLRPRLLENKGPAAVTVQPMEAVSDGYGLYLSVLCTPAEKNTLLLNASLTPDQSLAEEIGVQADHSGQTVAEWAATHGYTSIKRIHVFSDAWTSALDTFDSSVSAAMRLTEDGGSLIMLAGGCRSEGYELTYSFIPYVASVPGPNKKSAWTLSARAEDICYGTIRFDGIERAAQSAKVLASYVPERQDADEPIRIEGVDLLQSPLASYCLVRYQVPSGEKLLPIFAPSMETDAFSWPDISMHGRSEQTGANGTAELLYFRTVTIRDLPDAFELGGAYGFEASGERKPLTPIRLIRRNGDLSP